MIHPDRVFSFKEIGSEGDLVKAMTAHNWPLCYSFLFGRLLYLNDGESESSPEYVAVTIGTTGGHHEVVGNEVGRIKPRELSEKQVHDFIGDMNAGRYAGSNLVRITVQPTWHHSCRLCRLEEEQSIIGEKIGEKQEAGCMCMTEKRGLGHEEMCGMEHHMGHHMEHNMGHLMQQGAGSGIPLIGDKFPPMDVKTTHGMISLPGNYRGRWFVLFSHPADFTPVCTTEFVAFEKRREQFEKLNCDLIGLSIDQVFSHMKWTQWIRENLHVDIKFPIIADDQGKIAEMMGMIHPGKGANTVRAVFLVDPEATIRLILFYPQEVGRNMDEILRAVQALQMVDKNHVAAPANWPNNELIGDQIIIPPPADEKSAAARKTGGDIVCEDWWFCHRKL